MKHGGVLLIGLLLIAGIGGWFIFSNNEGGEKMDKMESDDSMMATSEESFSENTTLADIQARGGSWKCTVASSAPTADSNGVVYVSGKNVRADFTSEVAQVSMSVDSHMISDGEYTYTWSSLMPQGVKSKVTEESKSMEGEASTSGSESFDAGATLDYNCVAWPTDESVFVLPSDITFTALN